MTAAILATYTLLEGAAAIVPAFFWSLGHSSKVLTRASTATSSGVSGILLNKSTLRRWFPSGMRSLR
jgi:hypothetical protein